MTADLQAALAAGKTPAELGFSMPAETAAHAACWMSWPHKDDADNWDHGLAEAQADFVAIATAIAQFEPVRVLADPSAAQAARAALPAGIDVLGMPQDDLWLRDTGPLFLRDPGGRVIGGRVRFNVWGEKFDTYAQDRDVADALINHLGLPRFAAPLHGEGGGLHVDGDGTCITTETCFLNPNRNPGMTRREVAQHLCDLLGVQTVIWLPGDDAEWITDGHVDGMLTFVAPGRVIFETPRDPQSPRYAVAMENLRALEAQRDARGRRIEILHVDEAEGVEADSDDMPLSYVNAYIANGGVVIPEFGVPTDAAARAVFSRAFPDRRIVSVNVTGIAPGGGGIHCMTQQQPM